MMKTFDLSRYALSCATAAMLAGCGGSQPPIGAPGAMPLQTSELRAASQSLGYKVTAPLLYATNVGTFNVTVYPAKASDPAPLATISNTIEVPVGDCIDDQGTLYVANNAASGGWVSEYPLGKTTPSRMITDGVSEPLYCAIDAKGNLWVTNAGGPNVTEYLKGSGKPHTVIASGLTDPEGVAIDRSGNLYVGNGPGAVQQNVQVYAPGSKTPSRTITNGVTSPTGLAVDSSEILYVPN
ncbi:MAG: hypothetical protein WB644_04355, partial [Candidatus Cybelea sp.]